MKIAPFIAAGLMMAGIGISTEASAQPHGGRGYYNGYNRGPVYVRGPNRPHYNRGYGYRGQRFHGGRRYYGGRRFYRGGYNRCFTEFRRGRRITICR